MPGNVFILRTFGGLSLHRADADEPIGAPRRKSLALLALLAAHEDGASRDRVAALLWPDTDLARARHSVTQTIYTLRRELGVPDPVIEDAVLRLNETVVHSDVRAFTAALAEEREANAVAEYHGPFLDAVFFRQCVEFERWAEERRGEYARAFNRALSGLAQLSEARGDIEAAAGYWRRAFDADPLDADVAFNHARLLDQLGARVDALRSLRVHEQLLAADLGALPAEHVRALHATLRAATSPPAVVAPTPIKEVVSDAPRVEVRATEQASALRGPRRRRIGLAAAAALLGVVGVAIMRGAPDAASASTARAVTWSDAHVASDARLVVFPFDVVRGTSGDDLGRASAVMIASAIDGGAGLHVIASSSTDFSTGPSAAPSISSARGDARRLGADFFVLGELARDGRRLGAVVSVYRVAVDSEPLATVRATGTDGDLATMAQSLALQLLTSRTVDYGRLVQSAANSTGSLTAFKAFIEGEREFRNGHYGPALAAYRRAVERDSNFALAYYRMARAADWAGDGPTNVDATAHTRALLGRLPERERALLAANSEWERGRIASAENSLQRLLELYPGDPEALFLLGEVVYHTGFALGRASADARPLFERVVAQEPDNIEALAHLARIHAHAADVANVSAMARRAAKLRPPGDRLALELDILAHVTAGDRDALRAIVRRTDSLPSRDDVLYLATWRVAANTDSTQLAALFGRRLLNRSTNADLRMRTRIRLAEYALNAGSLSRALAWTGGDAVSLLPLRAYLTALPFARADAAMLTAYADSLDRWTPPDADVPVAELARAANGASPRLAAFPRGLIAIRLRDYSTARRAQEQLARTAGDSPLAVVSHGLAWTLDGEIARARGDFARATAAFDSATSLVPLYSRLDVFGGFSLARFSRAESLLELGRADEALKWYRTLDSDSGGELAFATAAARGRARALRALGRTAEALAEDARVARFGANAVFELQ